MHGTMPLPTRDYFPAVLILLAVGINVVWIAFLGWLVLRFGGVIG